MGERQVTVDGVTRLLPRPFLVLATQNPIEYEGTFPLPEAQLDRFLFKVSLGYLSAEQEGVMLQNLGRRHPIETLESVADGSSIPLLAEQVWQVHVDDSIRNYIVALTQATRTHPDLTLGASPRGALALYRGAQARASARARLCAARRRAGAGAAGPAPPLHRQARKRAARPYRPRHRGGPGRADAARPRRRARPMSLYRRSLAALGEQGCTP